MFGGMTVADRVDQHLAAASVTDRDHRADAVPYAAVPTVATARVARAGTSRLLPSAAR